MNSKGRGQELYKKAKSIIPGGTQLLSKRPEMFLPDQWPAYYSEANGCEIKDLDNRTYLDFSLMGVGSCMLGYNDQDVTNAVIGAIKDGNMSTLNVPEEVELAELLIELHPWAEMVRYARTGGEAMAIAVRLARAATGKDVVLFSGYHGWSDWYLAANIADDASLDGHLLSGLEPAGVPRVLSRSSIPFQFNDVESFKQLADQYKGKIGAIIVESIRNDMPTGDFIEVIHSVARQQNIPLIVDEITAGFRLNIGGAHLITGWHPDVAVFAKGISNGHPMAAIIGKSSIMQAAQRSFISSTYWTERTGPVAALATIRKMQKIDAPKILAHVGEMVQQGWNELLKKYNIPGRVGGILPISHFDFKYEDSMLLKTAFIQAMLDRNILATGAVYATVAHTDLLITKYLEACDESFAEIWAAANEQRLDKYLRGPQAHSGFKRLN